MTLTLAAAAAAQGAPATSLPIRELTAFKDGHAFVVRAGDVALGADGRIVLEDLPQPILGTFWPAVHADGCTLRHVTAGRHRVTSQHTAIDLRHLLAANLGATLVVRETDGTRYRAVVIDLPRRPGDEIAADSGAIGPQLPVDGDCVLLRTEETRRDTSAERIADPGTRLVRLDRIVDVTFLDEPKRTFADEVLKPELVLDVACAGARPATVPVELGWVEHGFRWIPSYRVELDGNGKAVLRLEATLVDDLADLADATVHLVVGVPSFVAKGQLDPMALQEGVAQAVRRLQDGQTQQYFSNAMMTQVAGNFAPYSPAEGGGDAEDLSGQKEQDLFVFTVKGITLKRGERMVLPVFSTEVTYTDVYKLDVPITPPQESWEQFQNGPSELARLLAAPKVEHAIRIENPTTTPFTTAPALVTRGPQVLAQGTMTYTPPKRSCTITLTTAVDLLVERDDEETGRTPNAVNWNRTNYMRIDAAGRLKIANTSGKTVTIEVVRHVFGKIDEVGDGGAKRQLNPYDGDAVFGATASTSSRYSWLWSVWSMVLNGVGQARWTVTIEPGKEAQVACKWHYFWQ